MQSRLSPPHRANSAFNSLYTKGFPARQGTFLHQETFSLLIPCRIALHLDDLDFGRERIVLVLLCAQAFQLTAGGKHALPLLGEFLHSVLVSLLGIVQRLAHIAHLLYEHAHALEHFVCKFKDLLLVLRLLHLTPSQLDNAEGRI